MILPRPYQSEAYDSIHALFETSQRTLLVLSTGLGKTVVFSLVARDWPHGRVMVVAPREELVRQAAKKIYDVTGEWPAIEMAGERSNESSYCRSQFVVASVQSLHEKRLQRFKDIGLLVIDEAHHAGVKNKTYGRIIQHFESLNPDLRVLGVTATPRRADGQKLQLDTVCYEYGLIQAIENGWLCEPRSLAVTINGLDLSKVAVTKSGDFDESSLAAELERDAALHEVADATIREAGEALTVIFTASVKQAEELARVMSGYRQADGRMVTAEWICGETPKPIRREILRRFSDGETQFLVNCGVLVEGFDEPKIGMLAMARPTRSQTLAMQMLGRGTRTLPGLIDDPCMTAADRLAAIAASAKPWVKVLDFVDVSRQHKLITSADLRLMGGRYSEEEIAAAKAAIEAKSKDGIACDAEEEAREAKLRLAEEAKARKLQEARDREELERQQRQARYRLGGVNYTTEQVDLFDPYASGVVRKSQASKGEPATPKQAKYLKRIGIDPTHLTKKQCRGIIGRIQQGTFDLAGYKSRQAKRKHSHQNTVAKGPLFASPAMAGGGMTSDPHAPATQQQKRVLERYHKPTNVTQQEAMQAIMAINQSLSKSKQPVA